MPLPSDVLAVPSFSLTPEALGASDNATIATHPPTSLSMSHALASVSASHSSEVPLPSLSPPPTAAASYPVNGSASGTPEAATATAAIATTSVTLETNATASASATVGEPAAAVNGSQAPLAAARPGPGMSAAEAATVAASATGAAALSAVAGGAAAGDVQALVALGLSPCSSAAMDDTADKASIALAPLPIRLSADWTLLPAIVVGNVVLACGVLALHAVVTLAVAMARAPPAPDATLGDRFGAATRATQFPSLSMQAAGLLFQGTVYAACGILMRSGTGPVPVGVVGAILCLAGPAAGAYWIHNRLLSGRIVVDELVSREAHDGARMESDGDSALPMRFLRYTQGVAAAKGALAEAVLPCGFWQTNLLVRRYGFLIRSSRGPSRALVAFGQPFLQALGVAVATNFPPDTVACNTQFGLVAAILAVSCVATMALRPYRSGFTTLLKISILCITATIALGRVVGALQAATPRLSIAAAMLAAVLSVGGVCFVLAERRWRPAELAARRSRQASSAGGDTNNVPLLAVPTDASPPSSTGQPSNPLGAR